MLTPQVDVYNSVCQIRPLLGVELYAAIDTLLSFGIEGAQWTPQYINNAWDGRVHLWKKSQTFPTGYLPEVLSLLSSLGINPQVNDRRERPELGEPLEMRVTPWDHQREILQIAIRSSRGLIQASTGSGKSGILSALWGVYNVPGVILVHRKELMYQLRESLKRFVGVDAGIFGAGQWEHGKVTVCMVQSLLKVAEAKYSKLLKNFEDPDSESDKLIAEHKLEVYNELIKTPQFVAVDECIPGPQKVLTNRGDISIRRAYDLWRAGVKLHALSYNQAIDEFEWKPVTYGWCRPAKPYLRLDFDTGRIHCTPDHKVLTPAGYIAAEALTPGMEVLGLAFRAGKYQRGKFLSKQLITGRRQQVFDLEVEDNHNFLLGTQQHSLVVSNGHHAAAGAYYSLLQHMESAYYRYGFSATAWGYRDDQQDFKIKAAIGDVLVKVTTSDLVDRGVLVPTDIVGVNYSHKGRRYPRTSYGAFYDAAVETNEERDKSAIAIAHRVVRAGEPVLIAVQRVDHGRRLAAALGYLLGEDKAKFVYGDDEDEYRASTLKAFKSGELPVLISTLVGEGYDFPALRNTISLIGGSSQIATLQLLGRGMRSHPGKTRARLFDIMDRGTRWLSEHSGDREAIYRGERAFTYTEIDAGALKDFLKTLRFQENK